MDDILSELPDSSKPIQEKPPSIDDINSILSGYKNITKEPDIFGGEKATENPVQNNQPVNTPTQEFYKTGKKAGQPKKPRVTVTPSQQQATLSGEILTGALFITLVDLCLPMIIAGLNNRFSRDKIKASDLYLTAKQKNELAPIADKVVKQFDFNANPNALLIISMLGIYGANFAMLKFGGNEKDTKSDIKK